MDVNMVMHVKLKSIRRLLASEGIINKPKCLIN